MVAFVLIGLVMVILVGFMLSVTTQKRLAPTQKSFTEIMDVLRTESVRNYVEMCLQKTAIDAVNRISQNGGEFEPSGSFLAFAGANPLYWIQRKESQETDNEYPLKRAFIQPKGKNNEGEQPPFQYWLTDKPASAAPAAEKFYPFGNQIIPALCQTDGANAPEKSTIARPCPAGFYDVRSIQGHIEEHITANAKRCIDAQQIQKLGGFSNVEFKVEEPRVTVILGEEDLVVEATYPVVVGVEKASREIVSYHTTLAARLKRVYGLAQDLARLDRIELSFDISDPLHHKKSGYYDSSQEALMSIEVKCPLCNQGRYDDVISILDKGSTLAGAPLEFNFARANRRPVLEFIHEYDPEDGLAEQERQDTFQQGKFKPFDLLFVYDAPDEPPDTVEKFIEFDIRAYDPDEDGIYFSPIISEDWKERLIRDCWGEYEEEDNEGRTRRKPIDLIDEETTIEWLRDHPPVEKGPVIANYADKDELNECMEDDVEEVESEWEVTPKEKQPGDQHAYRATIRRTAPLKPADFGYHTITVQVCDDQDDITTKDGNALCDSQQVVILVVDKEES